MIRSKSDAVLIEMAREKIKARCKKSLYQLSRHLLGFQDVTLRTHGPIIDALESEHLRKLICVPRGCLKSSLACVAYPIWLLVNNPNLRILIDSELFTNSSTFLREIRAHLEDPKFVSLFGVFRGDVWNESEIIIKQRTKMRKEASVTVGGIETTKVGQHYDVIIGDDYNSPNNSNTPRNAQKVVDHYKYNLSILEPTGTYVVIGTRYSEADVIGYILSNELGIDGQPFSGIYGAG
jgi:hypothetical protein